MDYAGLQTDYAEIGGGNASDPEVLDLLAATLAHEVKNPLSLMRANIEYMELCDRGSENTKYYAILKNQLDRADHLVSHAVTLLRDTNKKEPCRLGEILRDAADRFCAGLSGQLTAALKLNDGGKEVLGNAALLEMMVSNILKNSLDAGATHVDIRLELECDSMGEWLALTFADDGCGLEPETEQILQTSGRHTTKATGNGLGVGFCRGLAAKMGGTYSIANSGGVGNGCAVKISLPVLQ